MLKLLLAGTMANYKTGFSLPCSERLQTREQHSQHFDETGISEYRVGENPRAERVTDRPRSRGNEGPRALSASARPFVFQCRQRLYNVDRGQDARRGP